MLKFVGNQFFPLTRMARTVRRLSYQGSISRTERKFAKLFRELVNGDDDDDVRPNRR